MISYALVAFLWQLVSLVSLAAWLPATRGAASKPRLTKRRGLGQGMVWRWCPSSLAKLVPRTPISLWFMADITIVNGC